MNVMQENKSVEPVEAALRDISRWLLSAPVLRPAETGAGVVN